MSQPAPMIAGSEKLSANDRQKLWGTSREMEAVFNSYMLGDIGKKLPGTSESFGGEIYAGFFKDTLAHQMANGQHNGIAKMLYKDLTRAAVGQSNVAETKQGEAKS